MCSLRVKVILLAILMGYVGAEEFVQEPVNTTVCQHDDATFTCVLFIMTEFPVAPRWRRNGGSVDATRHTVVNNLTDNAEGPVYINSTITVNNVTVLDDDGALYRCGVLSVSTNNATLIVVAPPMTAPNITGITSLNDTLFTVSWTITNPDHNYILTLTNLSTNETSNMTVSDNNGIIDAPGINNYTVSVTAINSCGMMRSEPVCVYVKPGKPQFAHCISYMNGQPELEVFAYVAVTSRMSMSLTFSANYQTGSNSSSNSQSATCSSSDMQYNCTAKFAVDIIPSVDTIESVSVTVSGPYGSSSSSQPNIIDVSSILYITKNVTSTAVIVDCTLACMSSLECRLLNITTDGADAKNITNTTSNIANPPAMSYEYPVKRITISNFMVNTMYNYCIIAFNTMQVGEPYCDSFNISGGGGNDPNGEGTSEPPTESNNIGAIVGGVVGGVVVIIAVGIGIFVVYMLCCRNKDSNDSDKQELRSPTATGGSHTASVQPASSVPHQAAASGEEYALTSKVVTKPQQQQPPEEYAMVDKTKKHAAAAQGIHYADLQALPSAGDKPPPNQGPTLTYAMVA